MRNSWCCRFQLLPLIRTSDPYSECIFPCGGLLGPSLSLGASGRKLHFYGTPASPSTECMLANPPHVLKNSNSSGSRHPPARGALLCGVLAWCVKWAPQRRVASGSVHGVRDHVICQFSLHTRLRDEAVGMSRAYIVRMCGGTTYVHFAAQRGI